MSERDSRSSRRSSRRGDDDEDRDRKRSRREEDIEEETERLKAERLRKEKEAKLKELESKLAAKLEEEKKMKELSKITTYQGQGTQMGGTNTGNRGQMIEITLNDRLGKKVRVKACSNDTVGQLKKMVAAQTGTKAEKIRIQKWYTIYKDNISLADYEVRDGMNLELYYY